MTFYTPLSSTDRGEIAAPIALQYFELSVQQFVFDAVIHPLGTLPTPMLCPGFSDAVAPCSPSQSDYYTAPQEVTHFPYTTASVRRSIQLHKAYRVSLCVSVESPSARCHACLMCQLCLLPSSYPLYLGQVLLESRGRSCRSALYGLGRMTLDLPWI